jgi:hypothetical protein
MINPEYVNACLAQMGISRGDPRSRFDAGETMFVQRQLEYVMAQPYKVDYAPLLAKRFIPLDTSVPVGAETFSYLQWDVIGEATLLANYGDDIPMVDAFVTKFTKPLKDYADGYQYSVQDLEAAQFAGVALDATKATTAREMIDRKVDKVAAKGDTVAGLDGFLNHSAVPRVHAITGDWSDSTTADQMIADLDKLVNSIPVATRQTIAPNTLLVATPAFRYLQKPVSSLVRESVLTSWLKNNVYIKNVDQWLELDDASLNGGPRLVCYRRTPDVSSLVISLDFEQRPPQVENFMFKVPCRTRIGGISMKKPLGMAYMDLDHGAT